ncbi:Reticulocyte binding protein 2 b [Orchesella cincta]|uniref:Reticulocyte binding protein 2 b n=1 Tax=Orchesella cincta TaxID=48709 RepID=A0A1D2MM15_ORCCI|nr:Reticulocyte binding protein 2 b [Orchesella cincta]
MQKKLLQQKEREKYEGHRNVPSDPISRNDRKLPNLPSHEGPSFNRSQAPSHPINYGIPTALPQPNLGFTNAQLRPRSSAGTPPKINDIDNFNEPHPAAVVASMDEFHEKSTNIYPVGGFQQYAIPTMELPQQANIPILNKPDSRLSQAPPMWLPPQAQPTPEARMNEVKILPEKNMGVGAQVVQRPRSVRNSARRTPAPDIPPECMKYIQQVLPALVSTPQPQDSLQNQAFSSCTSSESSSVENVLVETSKKIHVSQTSEQLAGVRVTRKQYKSELQKQIDERKRREEELQRKDQEEEERIQRKIRIDQEKMQKEYEEDLRKQQEKELEEERKRQATLSNQSEFLKAEEELKMKARNKGKPISVQRDVNEDHDITAAPTTSAESLESIGEFFDATLNDSHINPDDRIIPVVAKRLMKDKIGDKGIYRSETIEQHDYTLCSNEPRNAYNASSGSPTARIRGGCTMSESFALPEPPLPQVQREMAIRSAPCPSHNDYGGNGLEFLASLRSYLQNEKSELEQRVQAKGSKSTEQF